MAAYVSVCVLVNDCMRVCACAYILDEKRISFNVSDWSNVEKYHFFLLNCCLLIFFTILTLMKGDNFLFVSLQHMHLVFEQDILWR